MRCEKCCLFYLLDFVSLLKAVWLQHSTALQLFIQKQKQTNFMKNLVLGMVLGAVVTGIGGYLAYPNLKKAAYNEGYTVGSTEGETKWTEKGIEEGIAQEAAKQAAQQKAMQDSLNAVIAKAKAARVVKHVPKDPKPEIENWRVLGGQLAEPIIEAPAEKSAE